DLLDLAPDVVQLGLARHVFERALELARHGASLGDPLPQGTRQARQVLRADDDQRHQHDDGHLGPADVEHRWLLPATAIAQLFAASSRWLTVASPLRGVTSAAMASFSSSSSFRPVLKFFTPLATSPITFGSLP